MITAFGKTLSNYEWAKIVGLHPVTLQTRVTSLGWSYEDAITMPRILNPKKNHESKITAWGRTKTIAEWSKEVNINTQTIRSRIFDYNMKPEEALSSRRKLKCAKKKEEQLRI